MFKGKAELIGPETGEVVATFTETGEPGGKAKAKVVLKQPFTLSGTQELQIFSSIKDEAILSIGTDGAPDVVVHEFGGESTLGVLPDKEAISLVKTPGGKLGSLLEVLGRGEIHREHY